MNKQYNFSEDKCVACGKDVSDLSSHICKACKEKNLQKDEKSVYFQDKM